MKLGYRGVPRTWSTSNVAKCLERGQLFGGLNFRLGASNVANVFRVLQSSLKIVLLKIVQFFGSGLHEKKMPVLTLIFIRFEKLGQFNS